MYSKIGTALFVAFLMLALELTLVGALGCPARQQPAVIRNADATLLVVILAELDSIVGQVQMDDQLNASSVPAKILGP